MVRALLTGDVAMQEAVFVKKVKKLLPDEATYKSTLAQFVDFVNTVTGALPVWHEASQIRRGSDMSKVTNLRAKNSLAFTATGLNIIGRIGYELFNSDKPEVQANWRTYATKLGSLSWDKTADTWKDLFVEGKNKAGQKTQRIQTQRAPVMNAVARARQEIGLDPKPEREHDGSALVTPA
jgi:hypothetical protein